MDKKKPLTVVELASMGGKARKEKTTYEQRSKWASKAAKARWKKERAAKKAAKRKKA